LEENRRDDATTISLRRWVEQRIKALRCCSRVGHQSTRNTFFFAIADSIAEFLSQGLLNVLVAFMRPKRWMDGRKLRNEIREEKKERKKEKNTLAPSQQ
jgi:hypothetical protein